jgi:hypothetical protein
MRAEQRVLRAVEQAQDVLARYVEPGPRDAEKTVNDLMTILDDSDLVEAVWELDPAARPKE